ncbi:MAG: lipopolysaccharide heptosyltransferase II [Kiritimatiellaeota bacterium]|nr:lipopolysaccharide heptosyltransferase II [Kiritimatiellota bacterium]
MPASSASASSKPAGGRLLLVGVNWLGDAIMSMPALQALRARAPAAHIALLTKPHLLALWRMHAAPDELLTWESGGWGTGRTVAAVRARGFAAAYILPNSFRAALIPWLARVPERVGFPGHFRRVLLTRVLTPAAEPGRRHQTDEMLELLAPECGARPPAPPRLTPPPDAAAAAQRRCRGLARPLIAVLPGAARGPSKRWPGPHFAALGRLLRARLGATVLLLGAPDETALCAELARTIGDGAHNLAGQTALPELAALLQASDLVVGNDSGGIHLAAALGTPVVGLFGITDPGRTGPLGPRVRILQRNPGGARDVPRDSRPARESLAALLPEEVLTAAVELLAAGRAGPEPSAANEELAI